jgi:hypothetical protein
MNKLLGLMLILVLLVGIGLSVDAQVDDVIRVGDCMGEFGVDSVMIYTEWRVVGETKLDGYTVTRFDPYRVRPVAYGAGEIAEFLKIEGMQIEFLGYGDYDDEMLGETKGFEGANLYARTYIAEVWIYESQEPLARFQVVGFSDRNDYMVVQTNIVRTDIDGEENPDGDRYDYHGVSHPNGGACMVWVEDVGLGWLELDKRG